MQRHQRNQLRNRRAVTMAATPLEAPSPPPTQFGARETAPLSPNTGPSEPNASSPVSDATPPASPDCTPHFGTLSMPSFHSSPREFLMTRQMMRPGDMHKRLFDVDTLRSVTQLTARPKHKGKSMKWGMYRVLFFPLYYKYWTLQGMSRRRWFLLSFLYIAQLLSCIVYRNRSLWEDVEDEKAWNDIPPTEIYLPGILVLFVSTVYTRVNDATGSKEKAASHEDTGGDAGESEDDDEENTEEEQADQPQSDDTQRTNGHVPCSPRSGTTSHYETRRGTPLDYDEDDWPLPFFASVHVLLWEIPGPIYSSVAPDFLNSSLRSNELSSTMGRNNSLKVKMTVNEVRKCILRKVDDYIDREAPVSYVRTIAILSAVLPYLHR
eukprot:Sspe_Gene.100286::Locus_75007_Transcript_2_2_Confidence_0.400_Length_1189::g.100286::m.100286